MKSPTSKTYIDENGWLFFVSSGISDPACPKWMTVRQNPRSGGTPRVKSPALPIRDSAATSEADLVAYASKRGWKER